MSNSAVTFFCISSRTFLFRLLLWVLLASLGYSSTVHANDCAGREQLGKIQSGSTDVRIVDGVTGEIRNLDDSSGMGQSPGSQICSGDEVKTGVSSWAFVYLSELNALVRLDENSVLGLTAANDTTYRQPSTAQDNLAFVELCRQAIQRSWLNLKSGALRLFTTRPQELDITTQYLNASIEGTEFSVSVTVDRTRVDVTQGEVKLCNRLGTELLTSGESGESFKGGKPVFVNADDAVQWAVFFPAISDGTELAASSARALELARAGRVQQALQLIGDSNKAFDLALSAMIHVTLGNNADALEAVSRAIASDSSDATVWLAQSYVDQAFFRLRDALDSIDKAHSLAPDRSDVSIRQIELLQVNGYERNALYKAKLSVNRFPQVGRAHAALGFLQLYNYELRPARRSFEAAMLLDETDPMPRLGLGLSYLRQGDLARAKLEMEIAVNLDPVNALLRTYLSRVYLELNLVDQASEQLEVASALDPQDPLPLFFDALLEQKQGNPPAALKALSESIDKVGSRAVYRSATSQDTDMAVVLSSRARIYESLGFRQMTLLDGSESLQRDPDSYVAHRLLADTYLRSPRLERSRQSELLQSQLRQPLNNNPGQFRLYNSRSIAFEDSGPFASSFNEYTRLFTREGTAAQWSLLAQSFNSRGVEGQVTHLKNNTLSAFNGFHTVTDGLNVNRDESLSHLSGFIQHRLSSRLDVQAQISHTLFKGGDDEQAFFRSRYQKEERNRETDTSARASLNFRQNDAISWLLNVEKGELNEESNRTDSATIFREGTAKGYVADLQNTLSFASSRLLSGVLLSHQSIVGRDEKNPELINTTIREASVYSYLYRTLSFVNDADLEMVIGLSYDRNTGRGGRRKATLSPKLGISGHWRGLRIRASALQISERTLIGSRTLEPSQIMGFTQTVDDFLIDHSRLLGIGIDRSFRLAGLPLTDSINVGGQFTSRRTEFASAASVRPELSESEAALFIYMPMKASAVLLEWSILNRRTKRESNSTKPFSKSVGLTHRVDIGVKKFWTSTLASSVTVNIRHQDGEFFSTKRGVLERGKSNYATIDLAAEWDVNNRAKSIHAMQVSMGIDNVLDTRFNYEDVDTLASREAYQRTFRVKLQSRFN